MLKKTADVIEFHSDNSEPFLVLGPVTRGLHELNWEKKKKGGEEVCNHASCSHLLFTD